MHSNTVMLPPESSASTRKSIETAPTRMLAAPDEAMLGSFRGLVERPADPNPNPPAAQIVQVLPRRRLLGQARNFEGLVTVPVHLEAHHQPAVDRELVRDRDLDLGTALVPGGRDSYEDQHSLVVDVEETLRLKADRGTAPRPAVAKAAKLLDAPHDRPLGVDRGEVELGVGRHPVGGPGGQTARVCVDTAHDLDVLLRHRRPVSRRYRMGTSARIRPNRR